MLIFLLSRLDWWCSLPKFQWIYIYSSLTVLIISWFAAIFLPVVSFFQFFIINMRYFQCQIPILKFRYCYCWEIFIHKVIGSFHRSLEESKSLKNPINGLAWMATIIFLINKTGSLFCGPLNTMVSANIMIGIVAADSSTHGIHIHIDTTNTHEHVYICTHTHTHKHTHTHTHTHIYIYIYICIRARYWHNV